MFRVLILFMDVKMHDNRKINLVLCLLLWTILPLQGQVNICYDFESTPENSRPMGWGALPNLDYNHVGVLSDDNTAISGAHALHIKGAVCYALMPDDGINYAADGVWMSFWYCQAMNTTRIELGYLTDASDTSTFHLLKSFHWWGGEWDYVNVDLSLVPAGARVAFRSSDIMGDDGTFWIDDVYLTSEPCGVDIRSLRVTGNWADSVQLEWDVAGSPSVTIGSGSNTYSPVGNSITVPRFFPDTSYSSHYYALRFRDSCDVIQNPSPCRPQGYLGYFKVLPYREAPCIAVTDIYSSMAVPYVGTTMEPYMELGPRSTNQPGVTGIYAGSHALNTFAGSDDGGMMVFPQTIPPGDNVTMRLGNRLGDWESASMLYTVTVDTNEADMLVMKYTMAMAFGTFQGPEEVHRSDTLHPAWFRIELLDDTMAQIQNGCNQFYIDMWDTTGWDEVNNMYKRRDFTGMAFDLSPYHGQRLHLRVTTCDGAVNNRWCYAYYNLSCLKRHDYANACSEGDSLTLTMPYGFRYRWYRDGSTATLDTSQSLTVAADSTLYHCQLTDRFDPSCSVIVSRLAFSQLERWVTEELVENDMPHTFRDVTFTTSVDTTFLLPSPDGCDTLLHYHLHVWPNQQLRIEHPVCPGDWPLVWEGYTFASPDSVTFTLIDSHGADSTVTLVAVQAQTYEVSDTLIICPGMPFEYDGIDYGGPVTIDLLLTSQEGCDSLVHLSLVERPQNFRLMAWYSDDGQHWADTIPIVLCMGQTLHLRDSTQRASNWTWTLAGIEAHGQLTSLAADSLLAGDTLLLEVENNGGCVDSLQWPVFVLPRPQAEFSWNPQEPVDITPEVQFINLTDSTLTQRADSLRYRWEIQNGDGVDTLSEFEPRYRWPGDLPQGTFDVTLYAAKDSTFFSHLAYHLAPVTLTHTCNDSVTHQVEIVTAWLQFPNVVTPNGDGTNDTWRVVNLLEMSLYTMNELWIYNKWGTLVYHVKNIREESDFWDPTATRSPDGTYFFRFSAKSIHGLVRTNGSIEVVR